MTRTGAVRGRARGVRDEEKAKWGMLVGDGSTASLPTPHLQSKSKPSHILA